MYLVIRFDNFAVSYVSSLNDLGIHIESIHCHKFKILLESTSSNIRSYFYKVDIAFILIFFYISSIVSSSCLSTFKNALETFRIKKLIKYKGSNPA